MGDSEFEIRIDVWQHLPKSSFSSPLLYMNIVVYV